MLLQLNIKNFALIEDMTISFDKGFNIFSGETGAGKSILIDAISFVLGSKFNKDLIRTGENKTYVEAIFTTENIKTEEALKLNEIDCEGMAIISREAFSSGKSIIKINGKAVLLSTLKQISCTLLDVHGQHENQNLLNSSMHIQYLDYFGGSKLESLLQKYKVCYGEMQKIKGKIEELSGRDGEREKLIDFLKYQIDEIENAKLSASEEKELNDRFSILSNSEKINKTLINTYNILHGDNNSLFDNLAIVIRELRGIEKHMNKIKNISDSLDEAYYIIEENVDNIRKIKDEMYFDENELEYINSRMFLINSLKKKYGDNIDEVLKYLDNIKKQYDEYSNCTELLIKYNNELIEIETQMRELANEIHIIRDKAAQELEIKIKNELDYIGLEKSTFKIIVEVDENLSINGYDKVEFYISTNPGEPLKSLEKVVSGGELSRIMLALKTVFVDKDNIPTVIFDEIDTGISGRVAQSVAEKMYEVSKKHQVFCVTHLPQIASMSDNHYLVSKNVQNGKTFTDIKKMDIAQKELEIARMIGGTEVTKLTLEHSKEMIKLASLKKLQIHQKAV